MPLPQEQISAVIDYQPRNVDIAFSGNGTPEPNRTLDPTDWEGFRKQAHGMLDDMLGYIENIRERPVWQPMRDEQRARFHGALPRLPVDLASVHQEFMREVLPFAAGNVHPGFMGWVHGGGTPVGMLAEMLAAGLNANLAGRDQAPVEVERQLLLWIREIFGFPESATGLFVTGTSMANLIALVIARDVAVGFEVRRRGVPAQTKRLVAYASTAVHGCIAKAMDICGIGSDALRLVATDRRYRINLDALQTSIDKDRADGFTPFLVVGSAGTVDTGAIDDLVLSPLRIHDAQIGIGDAFAGKALHPLLICLGRLIELSRHILIVLARDPQLFSLARMFPQMECFRVVLAGPAYFAETPVIAANRLIANGKIRIQFDGVLIVSQGCSGTFFGVSLSAQAIRFQSVERRCGSLFERHVELLYRCQRFAQPTAQF